MSRQRNFGLIIACRVAGLLLIAGFATSVAQAQETDAPFVLTDAQQAAVEAELVKWQQRCESIKTISSTFKLWQDDPVFRKQQEFDGRLSFQSPCLGAYVCKDADDSVRDHWVCDGKSIFDIDHRAKKLTEFQLPENQQGQLWPPFIWSVLLTPDKDELLAKYWVRTGPAPAETADKHIGIEFTPRQEADRARWVQAIVILDRQTYLPHALELMFPNEGRTVHKFYEWRQGAAGGSEINGVHRDDFDTSVPEGWKKVEDPLSAGAWLGMLIRREVIVALASNLQASR